MTGQYRKRREELVNKKLEYAEPFLKVSSFSTLKLRKMFGRTSWFRITKWREFRAQARKASMKRNVKVKSIKTQTSWTSWLIILRRGEKRNLLIHFPNPWNSWSSARLKPGTWNSIQGLKSLSHHCLLLPRVCVSRSGTWEHNWNLNTGTPMQADGASSTS